MKKKYSVVAFGVAAAGVMAAGSAQALALYENDTTKFDLYGRVHLLLERDNAGVDFENQSSRLGFRLSHKITEGLTAFARSEIRYEADENLDDGEGFNVRNSYLGVRGAFGSIYGGNFDSIYNDNVSDVLNLDENRGYRSLNDGSQRGRGDTIAYESPVLNGFSFGVSTKFQNENVNSAGVVVEEEATTSQAYIAYQAGPLGLALGFDEANEDFDDGAEDSLVGLSATYEVTPRLVLGGLVEKQGDIRHYGISTVFNYGKGDIYGVLSYAEDTDADLDDTQWLLGMSYKFSKPMYAYIEYTDNSSYKVDVPRSVGQDYLTVGTRYSF